MYQDSRDEMLNWVAWAGGKVSHSLDENGYFANTHRDEHGWEVFGSVRLLYRAGYYFGAKKKLTEVADVLARLGHEGVTWGENSARFPYLVVPNVSSLPFREPVDEPEAESPAEAAQV